MDKSRLNSLDPVELPNWRWDPFLVQTVNAFSLLTKKPYPIEEQFLDRSVNLGSNNKNIQANSSIWAFTAEKIRQARAACVDAGKIASVLNFVVSPSHSYDLPFLGADFVTLPGGHLVALDLQPVLKNDAKHTEEVWDRLIPLHKHWQSFFPSAGGIPEEAKPFFSPGLLWTKIPFSDESDELINKVLKDAYQDYLELYIDLISRANLVPVQRSSELRKGQLNYMRYRSDKDPARGMLGRIFGKEWTESYIHSVLFNMD